MPKYYIVEQDCMTVVPIEMESVKLEKDGYVFINKSDKITYVVKYTLGKNIFDNENEANIKLRKIIINKINKNKQEIKTNIEKNIKLVNEISELIGKLHGKSV